MEKPITEGVVTQAVGACQTVPQGKQESNKSSQTGALPNSSLQPPVCIERYAEFLKSRYRKMPLLPQGEWPPTLGSQYSEITMVERERTLPDQGSVEDSLEASFHGEVDKLAKNEKVIESLDKLFIEQPGDSDSSSLKVLIEGVPGAGKTTLVQKTCKDWAGGKSLQQFSLVVLVALRMKEFERANSVEELLPADDPDLKQEVVRNIKESSGELVLFIFDGFDELNESLQSSSMFRKIIQGELLHNCAVILTSRPYASDALRTDARIHRHVEILGFTEKQIESFIMHNISSKSTARSLVKSLSEQVAITSFSYTPLGCSILLYIFKQKKFKLPSTLTELFDAFISSIVKRHVKKQKITKTQEKKLDFKNLPEPLNDKFNALCKLAYDSLVNGKFLFSPQDIENIYPGEYVEANLLSLMTSATSFSIKGEETHYQFLHMTIQEFLAARWIATQSLYEQRRFLLENWVNLKIKPTLMFFAGITNLKGYLFGVLYRNVCYSDLVRLVLKGLRKNHYAILQSDNYKPHLPQKSDCTDSIVGVQTDPFVIELGITSPMPVEKPFVFETASVSFSHPSGLRAINPHHYGDAAQAFLCLASMIEETRDPSLVRRVFEGLSIQGFYLDFCRLTPMDCSAVANFLSKCPHHIPTLHFNFCSLTSVSIEKFHRISTTTPNCWNQCTKVEVNYNTPSFSTRLSLLTQIKWFQHTKVLCLRGLQYPKGLLPKAFQLHSLLDLKTLSDLTVTVERIPSEHLKDHEAVLIIFFEVLKSNNTLSSLTYDQSPPVTNCELFVQLMSALSQNKLLLTLGHAQVLIQNAVILPSKSCFKICSNGLMSAMKLADTRAITILEAHYQDLFQESCTCQSSNESKLEPRLTTTCDQCDNTAPAVIYCSNCSTNLCECCSKIIHRIKMFKNHKLIPVESISPDIGALANSLKSSSLAVLDISECTLTNEVAKHIGTGLAENKSLKLLNIKALAGGGAVLIFRTLQHNSSLQKLKISLPEGIGSSETVVTALSQMLKTNECLVVLDLSGCSVTDTAAQHIANGLAENKTLQALSIDSVHLTHEGVKFMYESLKQNEAIKILKRFGINLEILYNPFCLFITIEQDVYAALNVFKSLEQDTTVEGLVICRIPSLEELDNFLYFDDSGELEKLMCKLPNSYRINRRLRFYTLPPACNQSARSDDSEALGCAVEGMLTMNQTLRILDLRFCHLNDMIAGHIATGLAKNSSVKQLKLISNKITSVGAAHIFKSLEHNTSLEELELQFNKFFPYYQSLRSDGSKALGCAVEGTLIANQILKILDLQFCDLNDVIAGHMATGLAKNSSVKQLKLNSNSITSVGAVYIFKSLEHNTRLEELDLPFNKFFHHNHSVKNDHGKALGCAVEGMLTLNQTLRILDLRFCHLNDVIAGHIATGLAKNSSVKQLKLSDNRFNSVGAAHIFKSLEKNTSLEELDLSSNEFFSRSAKSNDSEALGCAVERMLTVNQTLRILNLRDCHLNDVVTGHIATGLQYNSSCTCDTHSSHHHPDHYIPGRMSPPPPRSMHALTERLPPPPPPRPPSGSMHALSAPYPPPRPPSGSMHALSAPLPPPRPPPGSMHALSAPLPPPRPPPGSMHALSAPPPPPRPPPGSMHALSAPPPPPRPPPGSMHALSAPPPPPRPPPGSMHALSAPPPPPRPPPGSMHALSAPPPPPRPPPGSMHALSAPPPSEESVTFGKKSSSVHGGDIYTPRCTQKIYYSSPSRSNGYLIQVHID